jgi:hypothetical protein
MARAETHINRDAAATAATGINLSQMGLIFMFMGVPDGRPEVRAASKLFSTAYAGRFHPKT